jgi:hypothetical protein
LEIRQKITKIDRKIRKVEVMYKMHHPKADIEKDSKRKMPVTI